jgi:UDP-3-O-[3-hydroxymyristoyl] glucosamine N-acyltransferase
VRIGAGTRIEPGAVIGEGAEIGAGNLVERDARIAPGMKLLSPTAQMGSAGTQTPDAGRAPAR